MRNLVADLSASCRHLSNSLIPLSENRHNYVRQLLCILLSKTVFVVSKKHASLRQPLCDTSVGNFVCGVRKHVSLGKPLLYLCRKPRLWCQKTCLSQNTSLQTSVRQSADTCQAFGRTSCQDLSVDFSQKAFCRLLSRSLTIELSEGEPVRGAVSERLLVELCKKYFLND